MTQACRSPNSIGIREAPDSSLVGPNRSHAHAEEDDPEAGAGPKPERVARPDGPWAPSGGPSRASGRLGGSGPDCGSGPAARSQSSQVPLPPACGARPVVRR